MIPLTSNILLGYNQSKISKGGCPLGAGKYSKKNKTGSFLYHTIIVCLLVVIVFSGWHVFQYYADSRRQETRYDELAALVEAERVSRPESTASTSPMIDTLPQQSHVPEQDPISTVPTLPPEEAPILPEYAPLLEMNPDIVGWIQIERTQINYPVMQSPNEPDFYLDHNFDQQYSTRGCIYVEEACDVFSPSDNITIYGHHMRDGSMFTHLMSYTSLSHWKKYPYVLFDTLTEHHTYEIFAVFTTTATVTKGFPYHNFIDAADEKEFDDFINGCISRSIYDTGIIPEYGDKVICLSTCEYSQSNGRLVVCAVRID